MKDQPDGWRSTSWHQDSTCRGRMGDNEEDDKNYYNTWKQKYETQRNWNCRIPPQPYPASEKSKFRYYKTFFIWDMIEWWEMRRRWHPLCDTLYEPHESGMFLGGGRSWREVGWRRTAERSTSLPNHNNDVLERRRIGVGWWFDGCKGYRFRYGTEVAWKER